MELATIARACGKLTVEAAAMARLPLAGTDWIPGWEGR
jgi:hypothetical protein